MVTWFHHRGEEFGGPSGGNGGRGGSVYALAVRNTHLLSKYRSKKNFTAGAGEDGKRDRLHGADGKDLEIALPVGSIITDIKTNKKTFLQKEGERIMILVGGNGGRGNASFKSSVNRSPKNFTYGKEGEEAEFFIEVELIADIGLIGLPNAGKTSFLNEFTRAQGKVGNYPFTTREPNLGEFYGFIISDIPGLIEGAAGGKGLGHKFLRHVMRTKMLVHLVSLENDNPAEDYKKIREELFKYNPDLSLKKEIVVLTKTDLIEDSAYLKKVIEKMKKNNKSVFAVSLYDDKSIEKLQSVLLKEVSK